MSWWWVAPGLLAVAAIPLLWRPLLRIAGVVAIPEPASFASARPPSQLGFSASHEGSDWRLVWNRDALARLNALGAMLSIRDGGVERLQFLSPQDLASGAIFYVPRTSDLTFNLKIAVASGADVEEQIRVLGATPDHVPQMAEVLPPRRIGEAARDARTDVAAAPAAETPKQPIRQFQPPARAAGAAAPPLDTPLPEVKLPAMPPPQIAQSAVSAPLPLRLTADEPRPTAPAPRQIAEPPRPALNPVTRIDPSPLRPVPAAWPRNVARNSATEVRIVVQIDARGRVARAVPVQRTVANYAFVDTALSAARMWTFLPALENGKPVSSETVLTFKFTP